MSSIAGLSRMSSVWALNANPHTATVAPERSSPSVFRTIAGSLCFWRALAASTASRMSSGTSYSAAVRIRARTSLGKHDPP